MSAALCLREISRPYSINSRMSIMKTRLEVVGSGLQLAMADFAFGYMGDRQLYAKRAELQQVTDERLLLGTVKVRHRSGGCHTCPGWPPHMPRVAATHAQG